MRITDFLVAVVSDVSPRAILFPPVLATLFPEEPDPAGAVTGNLRPALEGRALRHGDNVSPAALPAGSHPHVVALAVIGVPNDVNRSVR